MRFSRDAPSGGFGDPGATGWRGPSRRRFRRGLVGVAFAVAVVAFGAVNVNAASKGGPLPAGAAPPAQSGFPGSSGPPKDAIEGSRIREARLRESWRSKAAREERARRRRVFKGLSRGEARALGEQQHPSVFSPKVWSPLRGAARRGDFLDSYSTRVTLPNGSKAVAVSSLPLRARDEDGKQSPVDLDLVPRSGGLAPENPLVDTVIPKRSSDPVRVGEIGFGLGGDAPVQLENNRAFYADAGGQDIDLIVMPTPSGVESFAQIRSVDAPERVRMPFDLPAGAKVRNAAEGALEIVRGEEVIASVTRPSAVDAQQRPVPVEYRIEGDDLVMDVKHHSGDFAMPIMLDPSVAYGWNNNPRRWDATGWGAYQSNPASRWCSYFGDAYWGYGQYTFGRPESYQPCAYTSYSPYEVYEWNYYGEFSRHSTAFVEGWDEGYNFDVGWGGTCHYSGIYSGRWDTFSGNECSSVSQIRYHRSAGVPGNYAVFGTVINGSGQRQNFTNQLWGATVYVSDRDNPTVEQGTRRIPTGWTKDTVFDVAATDSGIGVDWTQIRLAAPNKPDYLDSRIHPCSADPANHCPRSDTFSYTTSNMPEGQRTVSAQAGDLIRVPAFSEIGTIKLDRTGPTVTASGSLRSEGNTWTSGGSKSLDVRGVDPLSGAVRAELKIGDKVVADKSPGCPTAGGCTLDTRFDIDLDDLSPDVAGSQPLADGTHTVQLTVTDAAGNPRVTSWEIRVERQGPDMQAEGTLKPLPGDTSGNWIASGEQGLALDATDAQGGVTDLAIYLDHSTTPAVSSPTQSCASGGCDYSDDLTLDTSKLSAGDHPVEAVARDAAGNRTKLEWVVRVERSAPSLVVTGDLLALPLLAKDGTYTVTGTATDPALSQAGMGTIAFAVDDDAPVVLEQECSTGGCAMSRDFTYKAEDYGPGSHTIKVTATDLAGNSASQSVTVTGQADPAASCPSITDPTVATDLAPASASAALADFQGAFPSALQAPSSITLDGDTLKPGLETAAGGLLKSLDALSSTTVESTSSGAAKAVVGTEAGLACVLPTEIGSQASGSGALIDGSSAFFANSRPWIDSVVRPMGAGTQFLSQLRNPNASRTLSWRIGLPEGQELKTLPDGSIAVVEPMTAGSPAPATDDTVGTSPSGPEQRAAVGDSAKQLDQASDDLERQQATTGDQVLAVIPKPWAQDKNGKTIATTMTAAGSVITLNVNPDTTSTFPLIASWQMSSADGANDYEAKKAAADTEPMTGDQQEALATSSDTTPSSGADGVEDGIDDNGDNASGSSDDDVVIDDEIGDDAGAAKIKRDPTIPLRGAAKANLPGIKFGLTESDPQSLTNGAYNGPAGLRAKWPYLRPIVAYNIAGIARKPESERTPEEKAQLRLWEAYYAVVVDPQRRWKVDVSFARFKKGTAHPSARGYGRALSLFFARWPGVTNAISAWNEPNYGPDTKTRADDDPLKMTPRLAGQLWVTASRTCFPKNPPAGFKRPCNSVVAGEFAGKPSESKRYDGPGSQRPRGYTDAYNAWLRYYAKQDDRRRPSRWGYHAYGDTKAYLLKTSSSRYDAPITQRYATKFKEDAYKQGSTSPEVWMSAAGAGYHYDCGMISAKTPKGGGSSLRKKYCGDGPTNADPRVLLGKGRQRDAAGFLVRRTAEYSRIKRFYYFNLQTVPGLARKCKPIAPGDTSNPLTCGRDEWGLVGAYDDNSYRGRVTGTDTGNLVREFGSGIGDYSQPNEQRPIFCLLRDRQAKNISLPRRTKCP